MVAFDPALDASREPGAMGEAAAAVATGAVTIASRDVETNGLAIRKGAWLGLAGGAARSRAAAAFDEVARAVLDRLLAEPRAS